MAFVYRKIGDLFFDLNGGTRKDNWLQTHLGRLMIWFWTKARREYDKGLEVK
jgi:hypothetical protein